MMRALRVVIDEEVRERFSPFLAYGVVEGVSVGPADDELRKEAAEAEEEVRRRFPSPDAIRDDLIVRALRDFLWRTGVDPTKLRPSSEALLRRVVRGGKLPSINNVVDVGNIVSLRTLVPIGIYDLDRLVGEELVLRRSREGEEFVPIGGRPLRLSGELCIADAQRPIHIYLHRDSEYTKVGEDTRDVLVIACGVPGLEARLVKGALDSVVGLLLKHAGGRHVLSRLIE